MLVTTTPNVEGRRIVDYHGLVSGEAILGANVFKTSSPGFVTWWADGRPPTSRS